MHRRGRKRAENMSESEEDTHRQKTIHCATIHRTDGVDNLRPVECVTSAFIARLGRLGHKPKRSVIRSRSRGRCEGMEVKMGVTHLLVSEAECLAHEQRRSERRGEVDDEQ